MGPRRPRGGRRGGVKGPGWRTWAALILPSGLLVALCAGLVAAGVLPGTLPGSAPWYPYVIWISSALLAWRFNRPRVIFAVLALALADRLLLAFAPGSQALSGGGRIVFDATAFLLPSDLAILAFLRERGLVSRWTAAVLGTLLAQIPAVFLLGSAPDCRMAAALSHRFPEGSPLGSLALPTPAVAAFALAITALAVLVAARRGAVNAGFLWAAVAALLALAPGTPDSASTLYLAAGALGLGLSVVEAGHAMAFRDDLTGLAARRALNETLDRIEGPFAVAMVDVDHFKTFNDRYGHDVGDQVLKLVAARLAEVGGGGTAYRYGGEEFAVIFSGSAAKEAAPHLETVRRAIAESGLTLRAQDRPRTKPARPTAGRAARRVSVTVSVGLAEGAAGADPHAVLKASDRALYRAKNQGRNRLCR